MPLKSYFQKGRLEAGCDEAGRGCLAGPVFAAAVILPERFRCPGLNDSKQVLPDDREIMRGLIEKNAIAWAVARIEANVIDRINILRASIQAMHNALRALKVRPDFILIDGNRFYPYEDIAHECVIGGDGYYRTIAAASILAKTYRDNLMVEYDAVYPQYGFAGHKGYGAAIHRQAIKKHGPCPLHRMTFHGVAPSVVPF